MREARLELLIGAPVTGPDGRKVGRIEEAIAVREGKDIVITEFHVGTAAFLERLSVAVTLFGFTPSGKGYRVPWDKIDLNDPEKPRLLCALSELQRVPSPRRKKGDSK